MTTLYDLVQTVAPASEPISLAEARDHLEIGAAVTAHDTKLTRNIAAARLNFEMDTGLALIDQTFTLSLSAFPKGSDLLHIPVRPLSSVTSVTYYDEADAQQTLSTSVYGVDSGRRGLYLKINQEWPAINGQHDGIVVTFVAGYGSSSSDVPDLCRQAVLLKIGKMFAFRDDTEHKVFSGDLAYDNIVKRFIRREYP